MQFVDFQADAKLHQKDYLTAYKRVLSSGWYVLGQEVANFESEFAKYLGVKQVIGVGNGLDALHIALMALNIGRGDEVITTPLSAVATTLAVIAVGAKPVFVDVTDNGQIDASQIESHLTPRTKAIIPVHLYGNACDITAILAIANKHEIHIIEDAAQAHGSSLEGKKLGTFGSLGCFSFYPTKNLGTIGGDAGAIATNDDNLAELVRQIRNYGEQSKYNHVRYGLNSRLDEIHAAVLRAKLTWLDKSNDKKRHIADLYNQGLANTKDLKIIPPMGNVHQYVITTTRRDELVKYLSKLDIPTLIHYPTPIHHQPFIADQFQNISLPVAEKFCQTTLSLPSHEFLSQEEVDLVTSTIRSFFKNKLQYSYAIPSARQTRQFLHLERSFQSEISTSPQELRPRL